MTDQPVADNVLPAEFIAACFGKDIASDHELRAARLIEAAAASVVTTLRKDLADLQRLVNTPELIDFGKGGHLEAVHQELRWGTDDRKGKTPYDWHWLVAHLAGRALAHHVEAERLAHELALQNTLQAEQWFGPQIAHHREKAVHHVITSDAALRHWHASVVGKHTAMQPGSSKAIATAAAMEIALP